MYLDFSAFYKHFNWLISENLLHKKVVLKWHYVHKNRTFGTLPTWGNNKIDSEVTILASALYAYGCFSVLFSLFLFNNLWCLTLLSLLSYPGEMSLGPASSIKLASLTEHSAKRPCSDWHRIPWLRCVRLLPSLPPSPCYEHSQIWKDISSLQHSQIFFSLPLFLFPQRTSVVLTSCGSFTCSFFFGFFVFRFLRSFVFLKVDAKISPLWHGRHEMQPLQSKHNLFYVFILFFPPPDWCLWFQSKKSLLCS